VWMTPEKCEVVKMFKSRIELIELE